MMRFNARWGIKFVATTKFLRGVFWIRLELIRWTVLADCTTVIVWVNLNILVEHVKTPPRSNSWQQQLHSPSRMAYFQEQL